MTAELSVQLSEDARGWAARAATLLGRMRREGAGEAEAEALRDHVFRFGLDYWEECAWALNDGPPFLRLALRRALDGKRRPRGGIAIHAEWSADGEAWSPAGGETAAIALEAAREILNAIDPFEET